MHTSLDPPVARRGTGWYLTDALTRPISPALQGLLAQEISWELVAYLTLTALALALRFWDVGARAMHHDESLHAMYAWYLYKGRGYSYDPLMHGPLQFYVMAFFYMLFGDSETTARLFAVLCGTALVFMPYFLRRELGRTGALVAAGVLTISPTFVYFSRFARDDIYLALFTMLLVTCMFGYLRSRQRRYIIVGAVAAALAMSSMEAAYISFFIIGSFVGLLVLKELLVDAPTARYVMSALRSVGAETWIYAVAIFAIIVVLLFSTFFSNPYGIFDPRYGLLSPDRKDILGGLLYWETQHGVARGGQPWYYYLLLYPLYEQFAVIFGVAGAVWAALRRDLFTSFLLYWLATSLLIYSWAGEKMPWLSLHPLLPAILLGAAFVGRLLEVLPRGARLITALSLGLIALMELHSTQALAYADGANPTEMLVYVQTSNDVPMVANETIALVHRLQGSSVRPLVQVDVNDVQGWPFEWYFRNLPAGDVAYTSSFANATAPILIMLGPEYDQFNNSLHSRYVVSQYRWNWWFPEDYKGFAFDNGRCGTPQQETACAPGQHGTTFLRVGNICKDPSVAGTGCNAIQEFPTINLLNAVRSGATWTNLWNWYMYRTPFGARGYRPLYFYVRKDLAPNGSSATSGPAPVTPPAPATSQYGSLSFRQIRVIGGGGPNPGEMLSPHGITVAPDGRILVADSGNHRVNVYLQNGQFVTSIGEAGTGSGQFNVNQSPMAVAVAHDGTIYVADWWGHRIERFSASGTFLSSWGHFATSGPYGFYGPRSIAVSKNGTVYVADTGNKQIAAFSKTGRFLFRFGGSGANAGQFDEPSAVAVGPKGDVYVADMWNQRIQHFDARGRFIGSWPVNAWAAQSYAEPYIAVLPSGRVAVTDPQNGRILVFTATGHPLGAIRDAAIAQPIGIAATRMGRLVVGDTTGNKLFVLAAGRKVTDARQPKP